MGEKQKNKYPVSIEREEKNWMGREPKRTKSNKRNFGFFSYRSDKETNEYEKERFE